jgi:cell shape-determining protein MreC
VLAVAAAWRADPHGESDSQAPATLTQKLEELQAQNRTLQLQVADLHAMQQKQSATPEVPAPQPGLLQARPLPAQVLGRQGDRYSANLKLLISLGERQGLTPSDLVLSGTGLLIDQGQIQGIQADQIVSSRQVLLGRTLHVGQQTALVQPVTDPEFRLAVRLVRHSRRGAIYGASGILVGQGTFCRLTEIAATEAVSAGDEVFTDPVVCPQGAWLYCGRVTRTAISATDVHWTIDVAPAAELDPLPLSVTVLTAALNPHRVPPPAR